MKVHFIAIGGSVMHNLALELAAAGHDVTGSDDEIRDPARTRLAAANLLPQYDGWNPEVITPDLDAVILGMHARADNPELLRALELKLAIYSFPSYIHALSQHKQRIVVAGSHGKTTITSMIMHVLHGIGRKFDYLVGASLEGFDRMVRLNEHNPVIILEGDEYFASALDPTPKFMIYQPHILVISGIAWDHINIYPTEESYHAQFATAIQQLPKAGMCVYNKEDRIVTGLVHKYLVNDYHYLYPYTTPPYRVRSEKAEVKLDGKRVALPIFGHHNAANVAAAWEVCKLLAVTPEAFAYHIGSFKGAALRLQKVYEDDNTVVIRDFAHAPSKVLASVEAVTDFYKSRNIVACLELHTFSSLNKDFIAQYRNCLKKVKNKVVMVSNHTLRMKRMPELTVTDLRRAFNEKTLTVVENRTALIESVKRLIKKKSVILLMSSGNFDGLEVNQLLG